MEFDFHNLSKNSCAPIVSSFFCYRFYNFNKRQNNKIEKRKNSSKKQ